MPRAKNPICRKHGCGEPARTKGYCTEHVAEHEVEQRRRGELERERRAEELRLQSRLREDFLRRRQERTSRAS